MSRHIQYWNQKNRPRASSNQEALDITRQAARQRIQHGLLGGDEVPRIPGRINQTK